MTKLRQEDCRCGRQFYTLALLDARYPLPPTLYLSLSVHLSVWCSAYNNGGLLRSRAAHWGVRGEAPEFHMKGSKNITAHWSKQCNSDPKNVTLLKSRTISRSASWVLCPFLLAKGVGCS